ncbi:MAG: tetratricopeptide repeat protein, partial [Nitrospirales bacterium]
MNHVRESPACGAAGGARNRRRAVTAGIGAALAGLLVASCGLSQDQIKKANGIFQEGVVSLETDQQQAFVSFQRAIQVNPEHRDAHYLLGHIYALQGRLELAEHEFREVLRIDPQYSDAHNYLGQVLAQQGRLRDAIRSYREALRNP